MFLARKTVVQTVHQANFPLAPQRGSQHELPRPSADGVISPLGASHHLGPNDLVKSFITQRLCGACAQFHFHWLRRGPSNLKAISYILVSRPADVQATRPPSLPLPTIRSIRTSLEATPFTAENFSPRRSLFLFFVFASLFIVCERFCFSRPHGRSSVGGVRHRYAAGVKSRV